MSGYLYNCLTRLVMSDKDLSKSTGYFCRHLPLLEFVFSASVILYTRGCSTDGR